jgi:hypothetical protein
MPTEIQERCETIEECYEFTLSYAALGLPTDEESAQGKQLRDQLSRAVEAMRGLEQSYHAAIKQESLGPAAQYDAFGAILARDAAIALVAYELVLAQPGISSQLIDNLNASLHVRALLTDLFLVTEILQTHQLRRTQPVLRESD